MVQPKDLKKNHLLDVPTERTEQIFFFLIVNLKIRESNIFKFNHKEQKVTGNTGKSKR